ncbi:MAG: hypothetical protein NTV51_22270 [Verrucomicrobia bacterium]|nr:hypothetical protein [Verrucomicrobiota bacterium]
MYPQLSLLDFGRGAAQQEENLRQFFYKSGAYQQAISGDIYLILGAKGAGKSAIFQRLKEEFTKIPTFEAPSAVIIDEPFSLRDLWPVISPVSQSRTNLWKLYFASLAAAKMVDDLPSNDPLAEKCCRFLARWGLMSEIPTKWQELRALKVKVGYGNWISTEFPPKSALGIGEIDAVLMAVSRHFSDRSGKLWLCVDSLDEVTIDGQPDASTEDILGDCMKAVG